MLTPLQQTARALCGLSQEVDRMRGVVCGERGKERGRGMRRVGGGTPC